MTVYSSDGMFEWDSEKEDVNKKKHGISFDEVKECYNDPNAIFVLDEENTKLKGEERYKVLGLLHGTILILMAITYRGNRVRIISARFATKKEELAYYGSIK